MLKPTISRQVEIVKTKEVSQQVENDANLPSLESSVSLRIMPKVTQGNDQVAEVILMMMRSKNRPWVMFLNPVQLEDQEGTCVNQVGLLQIWLSPMLFRSLKRYSRPHTGKLKSVQNQRCEKMPWKKR